MLQFNRYRKYYPWVHVDMPFIIKHGVSEQCILFGGFTLVGHVELFGEIDKDYEGCKIIGSEKGKVDPDGRIFSRKEYLGQCHLDQFTTRYWFETLREAELFWNTHKKISLREFCNAEQNMDLSVYRIHSLSPFLYRKNMVLSIEKND